MIVRDANLVAGALLACMGLVLAPSARGQETRGFAEADLRTQLRQCDELSVADPVQALARAEQAIAAADAALASPAQRARLRLCRGEMLMRGGRADEALLDFEAIGSVSELDD